MNIKTIVLLLLVSCGCNSNQIKENNKGNSISSTQKLLRNEIQCFINSHYLILSPEGKPINTLLIEFSKTKKNDTVFYLTSSTDFVNYNKENGYKGHAKIDNMSLLVFDKYDLSDDLFNKNITPNDKVKLNNTQLVNVSILGLIKSNHVFEIYSSYFDDKFDSIFSIIKYMPPPPN